jgi:hypothetical protein
MRGRKPRWLKVSSEDVLLLEQIARKRSWPWFQVQRARVVLAIAAGERVESVAQKVQWDPSTVWRICRRYEQTGLPGLLADESRTGHPLEISPPPAGANCGIGLSGTHRQRLAHHPLDQ